MRFTVPQFIERESRIIGPLTFRQFTYLGLTAAVCFVLYFYLGKINFLAFLLITITLATLALALAFLKIGGQSLPIILKNFLMFFISPKIFIWRKKTPPVEVFKKEIKKEKVKEPPALKVAGESQLRKLSTQVETKTR